MNWTCTYCETLNLETHTHCEVCSQPVPSWVCSECNSSNYAWSTHCTSCGKALPDAPASDAERIASQPLIIQLKPLWEVPGTIVARGVRNTPVFKVLNASQRFFWKRTPFLASEEKYKDVVWDGDTPVKIKVGESRESYLEERREEGHPAVVTALSLLETGDALYSVDASHRIMKWDALSGEKLFSRVPKVERDPFITASQGVMLGAYQLHIRVWQHTGEVQFTITHREDSQMRFLRFVGNREYLVAVFANGTIMVWRFMPGADNNPFVPFYTTKVKTARITALATSSTYNPRFAVGLANGEMLVWDMNDISKPVHRRGFVTPVQAIHFSRFGSHVFMSDTAGSVFSFSYAEDKAPRAFRQKEAGRISPPITCMEVVTSAGHMLAADAQGRIQVWNWMEQELIKMVPTAIPAIHTLAVNAGHRMVTVAGESRGLATYSLDDLVF